VLLTFFDFPAEHWKHLRTSNVVDSRFATVRLRQRVTKARARGRRLTAYKLLAMAQVRWRRLDGAHHLPLVRAGSPREPRAADRWRVGRTVPSIILSPA
jgi:putative transposase